MSILIALTVGPCEIYLKITFWLYVIAFIISLYRLNKEDYPFDEEITLGERISQALIHLAFGIWTAIVIWIV